MNQGILHNIRQPTSRAKTGFHFRYQSYTFEAMLQDTQNVQEEHLGHLAL